MSNKNIYIIQNERKDGKLLFMYKPFVDTISKLFPQATFLYKNWKNIDFQENDVVICVGCFFNPKILRSFKLKKLHVIAYWTEPRLINPKKGKYCDEIYLYSKFLFNLQKKNFDKQKIHFLPILKEDTTSFVNYLNKTEDIKLCFLGLIKARNKKLKQYLLNTNFITTKYNLFNDSKYNMFMINNTNIFLNLNQRESKVLPYCRICKLLSHKCIVISQHCNKEDDDIFKDIVYFCSIEDIEKTFNNLVLKSPDELNNISNEIYERFKSKFNIENNNLFLTK